MDTSDKVNTYKSENPTIQRCFDILKSGNLKIRNVVDTELIVVNNDFAIDTNRLLVPFDFGKDTTIKSVELFRDKANAADLTRLYNLCEEELKKQLIIKNRVFSKRWSKFTDEEIIENIKYLLKYYKDSEDIEQPNPDEHNMCIDGIYFAKNKLQDMDVFYIKGTFHFSFPNGEIYNLLNELFNKCKAEIASRQKTKSQLDALNRRYPGLTPEEVEGKTEEEIKYLFEHKRFQRWADKEVPGHKKNRESRARVEHSLDKIMAILKYNPEQQRALSVFGKIKRLFNNKVKEIQK